MTMVRSAATSRDNLYVDTAAALTALWAATLIPAAAILLCPGAAAEARDHLRFGLTPIAGSATEALAIATTNGRVVLAIALGACAASWLSPLRPAVDLVVGAVVLVNAALVGIALGAYGADGVRWLIHVPLEWAAVAVVVGLHLSGRRRRMPLVLAVQATNLALLLVGLGAVVETYLTPQG